MPDQPTPQPKANNKALFFVFSAIALVVFVILLVFIFQFQNKIRILEEKTAPLTLPLEQPTKARGLSETGKPRQAAPLPYTIRLTEMGWSPAGFSVSKGATLKITFINLTNIPQSFTIEELNLNTGFITPGKELTFTFTLPNKDTTLRAISKAKGFDLENAFVITVGTGGEKTQQELQELKESQKILE
jgi:hypothetical protein